MQIVLRDYTSDRIIDNISGFVHQVSQNLGVLSVPTCRE